VTDVPARAWVATRKGLFLLAGEPGSAERIVRGPWLAGYEVYHAAVDPGRPASALALVNHPVWGAHVFRVDASDPAEAVLLPGPDPTGDGTAPEMLWHVAAPVLTGGAWHLGAAPAALFRTHDPAGGWTRIAALERHPTRSAWHPAKGGLALHSIQVDPAAPDRLYVAVSAGGCYRSDDGGARWAPINHGVRAAYLADPAAEAGHNPHALRLHPVRPERLYRQDHSGVYRSDDHGERWTEITGDLPSDFGYALALDPVNPDRAWVVPERDSHMRCVCDARLRVFETRDAGATWTPRTGGLPQSNAYVSVLRDALCAGRAGLHLGTSTGQVFASVDGSTWRPVPALLPPVLAVVDADPAGERAG